MLIKPSDLDGFLDRYSADGALADDPVALARKLVAEGFLTRFQGEQLLAGRWRHFLLAGKYQVLERLGIGPMSTVLLCEHVTMKRLVALKLLPANKAKDPLTLARFHREARASARLHHPHVVSVYDMDSADGLDYLVAEFVDGSDLDRVVSVTGPMSIDRAANYLIQAAEGLQHAHEMGMVHRDIKPANLVLDRSGTIKLLDLGLARVFDDASKSTARAEEDGMLLGTIDYLAPEQAVDSHGVDIRADIYSLGATAYFLVSGRTLFEGASTIQKLAMHSQRPVKPVVRALSGIPEGFADILIKMLAKDPNDRFQTPAEVAQALAPWTTEPAYLPSTAEMPEFAPATRRAIERCWSTNAPAPPRTPVVKTPSGFQWPAIVVDAEPLTTTDPRPASVESGSSNWLRIIGLNGALAAALVVGFFLSKHGFLVSQAGATSTAPSPTRHSNLSAEVRNGEIPLVRQDEYLKVDLHSVASVVTTRAMFHEPGGPSADAERLILDDWSPRSFNGVPFQLVDPRGETTPNAVMLYSDRGVTPPRMPSSVSLKVNTSVKAIHFLGGISGWGAKSKFEPQTTSMIVRLLYSDGKSEDHPLRNAIHFSDFVQIADIPGSVLAFRVHDRHLRYFSIRPHRSDRITQIELIKGPDSTAPIVMAMTLETWGH